MKKITEIGLITLLGAGAMLVAIPELWRISDERAERQEALTEATRHADYNGDGILSSEELDLLYHNIGKNRGRKTLGNLSTDELRQYVDYMEVRR